MFLGMQDFDFIQTESNFTKFTQFIQIYLNFALIRRNFTKKIC